MSEEFQEYSVVFLGDLVPPSKVVLLKRSLTKKFAPGMYTGIGGHRESADENILQTMERELREETSLVGVALTEFARLIVNGTDPRMMFYSFGILSDPLLPDCNEGTLEWVPVEELSKKEIVATTAAVVKEWERRAFAVDKPWTQYVVQTNEGSFPIVKPANPPIKEGLYSK